jgi:hypothetical protein
MVHVSVLRFINTRHFDSRNGMSTCIVCFWMLYHMPVLSGRMYNPRLPSLLPFSFHIPATNPFLIKKSCDPPKDTNDYAYVCKDLFRLLRASILLHSKSPGTWQHEDRLCSVLLQN